MAFSNGQKKYNMAIILVRACALQSSTAVRANIRTILIVLLSMTLALTAKTSYSHRVILSGYKLLKSQFIFILVLRSTEQQSGTDK